MEFDYSKLKDPAFFRQGRLDAHSDHESFACWDDLEAGENRLRLSLNGYWKFFCARTEKQVIPDFEQLEYDCGDWEDIPVPAHIQLEGHGIPQYVNIQYPWDGSEEIEPGEIPEHYNPVACYVKTFTLPETMQGMPIHVSFQGAESCIAVWLNGKYVGFAGDSFTPSEFDLTPYLVSGRNKLACRVYHWCAGSWAEDQDFFRFSGLFRDVYLYALPEKHLQDIAIRAELDDCYTDGTLTVTADIDGAGAHTVHFALFDGAKMVAQADVHGEDHLAKAVMHVESPEKWSAEHPKLYRLDITLENGQGKVCEVARQPVGFRRFEMKNGIMCLNGERIVFKGVNRHDFCAQSGRAIKPEMIRRDLLTMKRNNINALRTSHYPNHSALYQLCDELGIYLIAENNLESHGVWNEIFVNPRKKLDFALPGDREDWLAPMLDRIDSTYHRDKNHPSILIWSIGNESIGGKVPFAMSQRFRELDNTRLVHYESIFHDRRYNDTSDMESQMYTPVSGVRAFLKEHRDKPFILCEYTHSMGNSNGAMHKYTEYAYEEPLYQGGFIWDYIDQALQVKDRYGKTAYLYGGDFGDRPTDADFSCNGITFADGSEPPKMQEVKYNYQPIVAVVGKDSAQVSNRQMFTDADAYDCVATLLRNGKQVAETPVEVHAAPGETVTVALPFAEQKRPGEYAVTLSFRQKQATPWAPAGHEVAFAQGVYQVEGACAPADAAPVRVANGDFNIGVHGEHFDVLFSKALGKLVSYRVGGREMLKYAPMPNFWRAPTENDYGSMMPQRYAQWKIASMYLSYNKQSVDPTITMEADGGVTVELPYKLPTVPAAECLVKYTVHPSGKVDVAMSYDPVEGLGDMPEFGMLLTLDADYDHLRYYGMGPDENYVDRCHGARLGIWETTAQENLSRYTLPQECGNRTGVRWAEVTDFRGHGLRFTGDAMEVSVLPYTPHELENARHPNELPPVYNTVVRLSKQQMGVGGDDSWGAKTHEEYLLDVSKQVTFTFSFEGI